MLNVPGAMAKRSAAMLDRRLRKRAEPAADTPHANMPTRTAVGMPPDL